MKSIRFACVAAVLAIASTAPAQAQVPGTYTGTTADGNGVTFVVGTDVNTGLPAVTSASISFTAPCKNSTFVLQTGWGFGVNSDINKGVTRFNATGNYYTFEVSLSFSADGQSATGTVSAISPTLNPVGVRPTRALYCTSPKQAMNLALQTSADAPAKKPVNVSSAKPSTDSTAETSN